MGVGGEPLAMEADFQYTLKKGMACPQNQLDVLKKR
jgi:hypothetical protein